MECNGLLLHLLIKNVKVAFHKTLCIKSISLVSETGNFEINPTVSKQPKKFV